jgi:hypothetical protein
MIRYLLAIVLFSLISYGTIEAWPLIAGPSLSVESPKNDMSYPGGIVPILGKGGRIALLTLNSAPVLRDTEGSFSTTLTFPYGASILTFVATDRFGRHITTTRSVFVPN